MGTSFRGIDLSSFDEDNGNAKPKTPELAPAESVRAPRPTPPKPNSIRSTEQSDLDAAKPVNASKFRGIDLSSFNEDTTNIDNFINQNLGANATPEEAPSIWHSINETMLNLAALVPTADAYNFGGAARRERFVKQLAAVPDGHFKNAMFKTFNDFLSMAKSVYDYTPVGLSTNGGIKEKRKNITEAIGGAAHGLKDLAVGGTKNIASKGFIGGTSEIAGHAFDMIIKQPLKSTFGAATGLDVSNNFEVMTPEQRAADIKMSGAIVTLGLGAKGINTAFGEGFTEVPLLNSGKVLEVAGRTAGKRFGVGALEGAVGGTIFGTISRAGDKDQLSGIITDALMFGSFGSTLNMLAGKRPKLDLDNVAYAARLLQSHENSSLGQVIANTQAVLTSQNIVEAAINGHITLDPNKAHVFIGLKNGREIMDALGKGANVRSDGKGGWDLLYIGKDLQKEMTSNGVKLDIEMWHRTGFMSGQTVSLGGHEYKIVGEGKVGDDGITIKLQDKSGTEVEMPASALRNVPGSEFRGRNQAPVENTLFSGVAYRGTKTNVDPLTPGHLGNTFMSEDPIFATIHSDKGGAVHRIEYKFKNPKQIPEPSDLATRQQYIKDQTKLAYEEGHDGLFIGELGSERLEIIDVTNDKTGLSVKERVDRSMMSADDVDFYMKEIKPRMFDGMNFHDAVADALGLTPEEMQAARTIPESDRVAKARVREITEFEKNAIENGIEQPKESFVDTRTDAEKAQFRAWPDEALADEVFKLNEHLDEAKVLHGGGNDESITIKTLSNRIDELRNELKARGTNENNVMAKYDKIDTGVLETNLDNLYNQVAELNKIINDAPDITATSIQQLLLDRDRLLKQLDVARNVYNARLRKGPGNMIEFKRQPDSALKDTKVLDENGNAKIVYHGTSTAIDQFSLDFDGGGNLMGPGFYFTEDPTVASGYTKKNGFDIERLQKSIETRKKSVATLEQAIKESVENKLDPININKLRMELDAQRKFLDIEIEDLNKQAPNVTRVKLNIRNPFDADKYYTIEEANKILKEAGVEDLFESFNRDPNNPLQQIPFDARDGQGAIYHGFDDIIQKIIDEGGYDSIPTALKSAGYDGITHAGGMRIGNKAHKVWIAFDPKQIHTIDADLVKINKMELDYTPPKMGAEKLPHIVAVRTAQQMELIHNLVGQSVDPYAMVQVAGTNGFIIDPPSNGGMTVLRDAESGIPIGNFTSAEKAREFINSSGQAHGVDLTDGGNPGDPPPIGPEGVMPPDGPPPVNLKPFQFPKPGKLETFFDSLNAAVPWIAMKRQLMTSLDKLHDTQLFSKVYQPTQVAALKALAVTRELMVPLTKIEKKAKGMNLERRAVISRYRQTMSPDEIINGLFQRPLNQNEIATAKHFAGTQDGIAVNIDAVYDYLRDAKKLNDEYSKLIQQLEGEAQVAGQQLEPEKIQQQIDKKEAEIIQLQELHGLSAKDLEAAATFEQIKRQNLNDMSLYGVTELAKAIIEDRPTRTKFAEENKMTAKELEIAQDFDNLYSTLADVFGIDKTRRINNFMNHYRRHGDMPHVPVEKPLAGRKSASKFLSDLIRSGEIYNYIDDPFHAAAAYIRSGVNGRVLNQTWADARIAAKGEISKIPAGARQQVTNIMDEYFNEIKGIPGAADNNMQVALETYFQKMGRKTSRKVRGDIVNGILSTIGSATLGYKPELGIRDIGSWFGIHGSRFGYSRAMRALRYAFEKDKDGISVADKMLREGHFPGLSPIGVQSAAELAAIEHGTGIGGRIAKFGETVGEAGLKVSLQKNFYAKMHTGAYLEASRRATKLIQDFRDGKITREQAYDRLGLHTYENPVAKHFDDLVVNSKDTDAAHFIGLATAVETNFFHGLSNHPYKWGTNVGRIAGQFGQWSMFSRDYLVRLASRGTPAQRSAAIGRFALNYAAIHGVGRLLGFNMRAWQILPGLAFTGGPMVQVMADNIAMTGALGSRKQKEAIGMFWNQHTSFGGFRSMFVPGSYAFHDILEAYAANKEGYNLIPVVGRGFGFKIDYTQRSFMDEFLGNYPKIQREKPLTTYLGDKIDKTFR